MNNLSAAITHIVEQQIDKRMQHINLVEEAGMSCALRLNAIIEKISVASAVCKFARDNMRQEKSLAVHYAVMRAFDEMELNKDISLSMREWVTQLIDRTKTADSRCDLNWLGKLYGL